MHISGDINLKVGTFTWNTRGAREKSGVYWCSDHGDNFYYGELQLLTVSNGVNLSACVPGSDSMRNV